MEIQKDLAVEILKYLDKHKEFYFPFQVICKEFVDQDNEPMEVEPTKWGMIRCNKKYQTFELRENLQNLDEQTLRLMVRGFLEKITGESVEGRIKTLAENYRKDWKEELWESEDTEEFGFNEFIGGKADAFEECLEIIKNYNKH